MMVAKALGASAGPYQTKKRYTATCAQYTLLPRKRLRVSRLTFPHRVRSYGDFLWHLMQLSNELVEKATFPLWHVPHALPSL